MPFVTIRYVKGILGEGEAEKQAEINRRLVDVICEATGLADDQVWVTFEPLPNTEWFVGHKRVQQIWKEQGRE